MEETLTSVEFIIVMPHNQYRFKYRINDGSYHFISKYDAPNFFSKYIEIKDKRLLVDFVSRFRPFVILPEEKEIFELSKIEEVLRPHGTLIDMSEKEILKVKVALEEEEEKNMYHNDTLLSVIQRKVLKK